MHRIFTLLLLFSTLFYLGCSQEQPARTVREFLDNPQFLEAAVVRCSQNRAETRYDAACINARQAVSVIEASEERAQRDRLEDESQSKRDALRRRQRAATAARRHAAEREQLRREAEYLAQFGELPPVPTESDEFDLEANAPGVVIPKNTESPQSDPPVIFDEPVRENSAPVPASDAGNAPVIDNSSEPDLNDVREELRRRQDEETD